MPVRALADADAACGAKAHGLARLIAAGLPVPDGFVIEAEAFRDAAALGDVSIDVSSSVSGSVSSHLEPDAIGHALAAAADRIASAEIPGRLAREVDDRAAALGRLAVRSSASVEDGALGAAAGVFASLTDVAPGDAWPAIRAVWTSALTSVAVAYARRRGAAIAISVIVQRFVPGERCTVYTRPIGAPRGSDVWLSRGGPLEQLPRSSDRAEAALALAAEAAIDAGDGADVELVVARAARSPNQPGRAPDLWVVQARPMIHPVRRPRPAPPPIVLAPLVHDSRRWTWDIAHNPDPLSPAQAGLVERIDRTAWSPVALRVCGGYLYTAPRAGAEAEIEPPAPPANRTELAARLAPIEARLAALLSESAQAEAIAAGPGAAIDSYVAALQIWTRELSPLVAAARRVLRDRLTASGDPLERIPARVADLIGPRRVLRDPVMSPAWDVAVPTFAETGASERALSSPTPPDAADPANDDDDAEIGLARAAADAAEQDDLWFARAQWLVRRSLLAIAEHGRLRGDDIFWIPLDDAITLRSLDPAVDPDDIHRRASAARAAHARAAEWDMPLVVHDGACVESPRDAERTMLRGVGSGPRVVGRVVRFASLAAARPIATRDQTGDQIRDQIVVVRAVTPALAMLVDGCAALVSETGGLLDHGAALARELGATCVVGCTGAWSELADGARVAVDGDAGLVIPL